MADQDDFITIRPREVALSGRDDDSEAGVRGPRPAARSRRTLYALLAMVLGAAAIWVFLILPGQVGPVTVAPASGDLPLAVTGAPASDGADATEEVVPPYRQLELERARERAEDALGRFVELELRLEQDMHVDNWAPDAYAEAREHANSGDELFLAREYDGAVAAYHDGADALEQLVADGTARFREAVAAGKAALMARSAERASAAFRRALVIFPEDPEALAGARRSELLPEVNALWQRADDQAARGELDAAMATYEEIRSVDPLTSGLDGATAALGSMIAERRFQEALSAGYTALDEDRYGNAREAFEQALTVRQDHPAALAGLQQTRQGSTLRRIDALQREALAMEADDQWTSAIRLYEEALEIDPALKFAREGRARAVHRADLDRRLDAVIGAPETLSSDRAYQDALALLEEARRVEDAGPGFTRRLEALAGIVTVASEPVALTLVSDDATEVTVSEVGALGTFERREINVRPGRYVIVGSQDGCRDVRKEINVVAGMNPVVIRCKERI